MDMQIGIISSEKYSKPYHCLIQEMYSKWAVIRKKGSYQ